MLSLKTASYEWAITHLLEKSDTDLFPKPFELDAIECYPEDIVRAVQPTDIESYSWSKGRRALIPKGELSFRSATQLDPWDSLILTALIREFGDAIERKRIPYREGIVFSYRFEPTQNGEMYQREADWPSFWEQSIKKAASISGYVAIADISSYYNQIYHPVLEEHLRQAGVPEKAVEALVRLCDTVTPGASRGIPVGPHASHLLAECVFDLIDRNLQAKGYIFCRFVDDIHIFCKTREQAHMAFYDLVNIISGLELNLQNHKSDILSKDEFIEKAKHVLIEAPQPVGDLEKGIIAVIDRHSNGDRYRSIDYSHLTKEDLAVLSQPNLEAVLRSHLTQNEPDFIRIRWLFRRLAQVGVPGAVPIAIEKLEQFSPAVDALASYLLSARNNYSPDGWKHVGKEILHTLDLPIIQHSEYLTVILLDLFARLPALNHIDNILQKYDTSSSLMEKRKIIRIATVYPAADWLDQIIERPSLNDAWLRRAFIAGASAFSSRNERNH